jgi:hypothetical protein
VRLQRLLDYSFYDALVSYSDAFIVVQEEEERRAAAEKARAEMVLTRALKEREEVMPTLLFTLPVQFRSIPPRSLKKNFNRKINMRKGYAVKVSLVSDNITEI